ncbi:hypothetical protein [Pacificibacter marinus]|uniref:hypothetical protein n=1 Tax=Pacificibacter marinus TaxID=658057 RepID=UPI001C06ED57|nr:hypothetical protein [Pacificibacter marinus]MBU2867846.1 hypothetical protein [Pacificibacter marinus]
MGQLRPILKPAEMRRAVTEWVSNGFSVSILPDGQVKIMPPSASIKQDAFDLVDMKQ